MDGDRACEGRLVNRQAGSYKGHPLSGEERPAGIEKLHG
jgi:hypothetical protein